MTMHTKNINPSQDSFDVMEINLKEEKLCPQGILICDTNMHHTDIELLRRALMNANYHVIVQPSNTSQKNSEVNIMDVLENLKMDFNDLTETEEKSLKHKGQSYPDGQYFHKFRK